MVSLEKRATHVGCVGNLFVAVIKEIKLVQWRQLNPDNSPIEIIPAPQLPQGVKVTSLACSTRGIAAVVTKGPDPVPKRKTWFRLPSSASLVDLCPVFMQGHDHTESCVVSICCCNYKTDFAFIRTGLLYSDTQRLEFWLPERWSTILCCIVIENEILRTGSGRMWYDV